VTDLKEVLFFNQALPLIVQNFFIISFAFLITVSKGSKKDFIAKLNRWLAHPIKGIPLRVEIAILTAQLSDTRNKILARVFP
jgi:hypothetical protein